MTSNPLSEEEIEQIAARAAKATAGPWHLCGTPENPTPVVNAHGDDGYQVHSMLHVKDMYPGDRPGFGTWDLMKDTYCRDAAFIAHARSDVPALLSDRKALEARIKKLEGERDDLTRVARAAQVDRETWRNQIAFARSTAIEECAKIVDEMDWSLRSEHIVKALRERARALGEKDK